MTESSFACRVCGSAHQTRIGELPLYLPEGQAPSDLLRCADCGTWARSVDFDDPEIRRHFDRTSYTVPEREAQVRANRIGFLRGIMDLSLQCVSVPPHDLHVLDVGVAYGHMLELYRDAGARGAAIETVGPLRERLRERGFEAYQSAREIPDGELFDIITSIDSFYYFEKPEELLRELHPHLKSEGVLILRLANRTPILRLLRLFRIPITNEVFGDVKHNFTYRSVCSLLQRTGYKVERVILRERGKSAPTFPRWVYYRLSLMASRLTGLKLTPGIILVCRRV